MPYNMCGNNFKHYNKYGVGENKSRTIDKPQNDEEEFGEEEEEGTFNVKGKNCKFECLIMTLYPCSLANWLIIFTLFILFAFLILPEELDIETNQLVPDWTQALLLSVALYFPISFSYHFVTKYMK